jgi:8-oxo-dGTP pyrophosphatase MutT (NUDIX family)
MEVQNKEMHRIDSTAIIYRQRGDDFEYLITKRSLAKKAFPGKWTVPGGGLDTDDYTNLPSTTAAGQWYFAIEKSLMREVKEEVDLEIDRVRYLLDLAFIIPGGAPAIVLSFYARYVSGEVTLDEDSIEFVWATAGECKNYELIDGIFEEIEMVDKILKGGDEDEIIKNSPLRK